MQLNIVVTRKVLFPEMSCHISELTPNYIKPGLHGCVFKSFRSVFISLQPYLDCGGGGGGGDGSPEGLC